MNKGFTLIELIVAIFILAMGTVGAFILIQKTIAFTSISSSQLQASYLAQEGIEIIRNIRDTNYLKSNDWDYDIDEVTDDYRIDYTSERFPDIICGDYLKEEAGFYVCSIDESKFQRKITIAKPESDRMVVSVEVSWSERGNEHSVLAQTELYNWR